MIRRTALPRSNVHTDLADNVGTLMVEGDWSRPVNTPAHGDDSVSVVIPCYNGMPYLRDALASALGQTHRPTQIIVVDDGSTDDSAACVRDHLQRQADRGLELLCQTNAGESGARNRGIAAATGRWVAQLDADDWWEPTKLEKQLAAAAGAGGDCVMVHSGQVTHHRDGQAEALPMQRAGERIGWCTDKLIEPVAISHSSVMMRRDALNDVGGYDSDLEHAVDIDVYFKLSAVGTFAFVNEHLTHYRLHEAQTSWNYRVEQVLHYHDVVWRFFESHPDMAEQIGRERIGRSLAQLVCTKLESFYWNRRFDEFRRLLEFAQQHHGGDPTIVAWQRRARLPDWLIRVKDRVMAGHGRRSGQG